MTVLCAARGHDGTWIGSDTGLGFAGDLIPVGPKWVVRGSIAIGTSGDSRALALLREHAVEIFDSPEPFEMASAWRAACLADGFKEEAGVGPKRFAVGGLIVIVGRGIWHMDGTFTPVLVALDYMATGSGTDYAMGAMWANHPRDSGFAFDAQHAVHQGLRAAIAMAGGCGGEPWIAKVPA